MVRIFIEFILQQVWKKSIWQTDLPNDIHLPSLTVPVLYVPTRFFLSAFSLPSTVLCSSSVWLSSSKPLGWRVMPRATRIWNSLQAQSLFVSTDCFQKKEVNKTKGQVKRHMHVHTHTQATYLQTTHWLLSIISTTILPVFVCYCVIMLIKIC